MLDHLLATLLVVVVPAHALWRSRRNQRAPKPKTTRYLATLAMATGLLALLALDWIATGRTAMALGLGAPTTTAALIGLGLAATLLIVLGFLIRRETNSAANERAQRELLPETPREFQLFLLFSVATGVGWEVLYRGFLLYYFQPSIGLTGAVVTAALAYGVAHGFKDQVQFVGSIGAAFAFTIGYAATGNIWWLILLHMGLPLLSLFGTKDRKVEDERYGDDK